MARIVVGTKKVEPDLPAHVSGVHEGNWPARGARRRLRVDSQRLGSPRRSTGIAPNRHATIDPRMPLLTPP